MIHLKEFLKTLKGTDFKEEELKVFYRKKESPCSWA